MPVSSGPSKTSVNGQIHISRKFVGSSNHQFSSLLRRALYDNVRKKCWKNLQYCDSHKLARFYFLNIIYSGFKIDINKIISGFGIEDVLFTGIIRRKADLPPPPLRWDRSICTHYNEISKISDLTQRVDQFISEIKT